MAHVVSASLLKARGKPAVYVNPPVNLFGENYINHPADEDSRKKALKPEQESDQEGWNSIDDVQKENVQGRTDQGHVFRFVGSTDLCMMLLMGGPVLCLGAMEQETVIGIFEGVSPDQTDDHAN